MKRFANPRALVAILAVSFGLAAGGSLAAPPHERGPGHCPEWSQENAPPCGYGPGWHQGWGRKGGYGMGPRAGYGPGPMFHGRALAGLYEELKLDAKQEALWKEAWNSAGEHRDTVRAHMASNHAEIKALIDQPGADLRAVEKRMGELRAEGQKLRDAAHERWFAVYDSLGDGQKEKVRLFLKDGMEKTERFVSRARERAKDRQERVPRSKTKREAGQ